MTPWLLILFFKYANAGGATTAGPFYTEASCQAALADVNKKPTGWGPDVYGTCVPEKRP